ncbi:long-chain-fatty-acid--CoA ligase [Planctomicrobium piriforme]|uniref:Long-chain acyl-CoA synthetase n=1 Tax=Planctomicrobium piriforme TaxID=1576369 RepID=A0A1I3L0D8_9PLAN|nr:long-chain fatty acid--CoA ligase [Planctomicrobium piriforme]SFI78209.1 long-chain acyl-CoA synthetase [Planctomicrobium piriforme]
MDQLTRAPEELMERNPRPWLKHYPDDVPASLSYPPHGMPWLLERAVDRWPGRTACIYYDEHLTYTRLLSRARRIAQWLVQQGLQPGDRVGLLLPNTPEYIAALNGIWLAGGTAVALSPLFVPEEAGAFVAATQCKIVITLDVLSPLVSQGEQPPETIVYSSLGNRMSRLERLGYAWVRLMRLGMKGVAPVSRSFELRQILRDGRKTEDAFEPVAVTPADRAYILPTGGTTSAPKAVTLTHANLMANAWQLCHWAGNKAGEEVLLAVLPFFHSYGLSTCLTNGAALGATLVLHHRFRTTSVLRLLQEHQPTIFPAVPAMLAALNPVLEKSGSSRIKSLKAVISGGAPLPASISNRFSELTGAEVVEGYGLSEASPVTHAGPLDGRAISGTIGLPLPDTDAKIVDAATGTEELPLGEVGELIVRGPQVMQGYWNDPEATANAIRDGWLYTGDLGTCDHHGYFRIVDRKKDLIITSGFNVYPGDVEAVLKSYPGVKELTIVGVPDESKGEIVKSILVMKSGKTLNRHDFLAYCRKHLAAHKRPRLIEERTEDLPRNFLGKVLRRELRNDTGHRVDA